VIPNRRVNFSGKCNRQNHRRRQEQKTNFASEEGAQEEKHSKS
jgi:hypothetical protein